MENTKPAWQSKTIILNAIGGLIAVASVFTHSLDPVSAWVSANSALVASVWAVLGIVLRLVSKDKIVLVE